MKMLYVDGEREFILLKLKNIYNCKAITIKYAALYIYKENGLIKRGQRIVMTMKNFLLIGSNLSLEFQAEVIDIANYL